MLNFVQRNSFLISFAAALNMRDLPSYRFSFRFSYHLSFIISLAVSLKQTVFERPGRFVKK